MDIRFIKPNKDLPEMPRQPQTKDQQVKQEAKKEPEENKLSRREAFAFGASGLMTIAAAFTGTGWMRSMSRIDSVQAACDKTYTFKNTYDSLITEYREKVPPLFQRFLALKDVNAQVSELQKSISEATSFKDLNPENIVGSLLGTGLDIVKLLAVYIGKVSELIEASQNLLAELDGWLSPKYDIDVHLFQPIRPDLFNSIDNLADQVDNLKGF